MNSSRTYPVPRAVSTTARVGAALDPISYAAVTAAGSGSIRGCHLPILASSDWLEGGMWARAVLQRQTDAAGRKRDALLAAISYDPSSYAYHGMVDPNYEFEMLTSVVRQPGYDGPKQIWDGLGWGDFELGEDDAVYAVLDEDTLADLLEAVYSEGSGGLVIRPTQPRAWIPGKPPATLDQYAVVSAGSPPRNTGVMVALYPAPEVAMDLAVEGGEPVGEIHLTLAYLGDTAEDDIDYQAVQRATAKWARMVRGPLDGEVSGKGVFTAGPRPVTYASVDVPGLPGTRQMLINLLEAEGVPARADHGYTPHMTIAYDELDDYDPTNHDLQFYDAVVAYADDHQRYPLGGTGLTAAGGTGPDVIYAIVDEMDSAAVLDVIRVSPGPVAYRRVDGKWVADRDVLLQLMGVDPPPVVEVDPAIAEDVVGQVDAFDSAKPKKKPVTAAGASGATEWDDQDEKKHPRAGGKFAKKQGTTPANGPRTQAKAAVPPRGPSRGPGGPPAPGAPAKPAKPATAAGGVYPASIEASGVPDSFFKGKPPGFREWLEKYLADKAAPKPAASATAKSTSSKPSNSDKTDSASKTARDKATAAAKADAKEKAIAADGGFDLSDVPAEYKQAMREFLTEAKRNEAQGSPAERKAAAIDSRTKSADAKDRDFELSFAKQGLSESRRREAFARELQGLEDRLTQSGADPAAIRRLMAAKAAEEKRARAAFAAKRRLLIAQEKVRRIAMRNAEKDQQDREGITADASRMPPKLKTFWTKGEGAAKIKWGVGGDFNRCRKALAKYVPAHMVSGACASLHHLATGSWPGKGRDH